MAQNANSIWRNYVTDGVPSSGIWNPVKQEIREWGEVIEKNSQLANSPLLYGAKGDGAANDNVSYAATEAANDNVFLPTKTVFNLGTSFPSKPVFGPGAIKMGANTYGGAQLTYDPYRTEAIFQPDSYERKTGLFPTGNRRLNMIFSPAGVPASANISRSSIFGNANGTNSLILERVELFGDGAGRLMRYGMRNTAIGSIALEQMGAPDVTQHNYWIDAGGFIPGQASWNYDDLEVSNPGIGAKIATWLAGNPLAITVDQVAYNVGVGRNAMNGSLIGTYNTGIGYRALAGALAPQGMTALGCDVFRRGVFVTNSIGAGYLAANSWQEGTRVTVIGYQAASATVSGSTSVIVGAFAGSDFKTNNGSVFIGFAAGNGITNESGAAVTDPSNILAISNASGTPLISGNFFTKRAGINIMPGAVIRATFHVQTSSFGAQQDAHVNGSDLIIEKNGNPGITLRTIANGSASIFVAIPGTTNKHGIIFNDSAGSMVVRVANGDRFTIGSGIMAHDSLPTANPGAGTKRFWVDTAASNTVKYAA